MAGMMPIKLDASGLAACMSWPCHVVAADGILDQVRGVAGGAS